MDRPSRTARVLVVENNSSRALTLQRKLEAEGFEVEVAEDGRKGRDALRAASFDLVLCDVSMPRLSGHEQCRKLKDAVGEQDVAVVLLTTIDEPGDVLRGLECGADAFIDKCSDLDHIVGRVQAILAEKHSRKGPDFGAGTPSCRSGNGTALAVGNDKYNSHLSSIVDDFLHVKRREQEMRRRNARLEHRLERLESLRRIDRALSAGLDMQLTLDLVLEQVSGQLQVAAAAVLLLDPHTHTLSYAARRGFRGPGTSAGPLSVGEGLAGRAAAERRIVASADLARERDPFGGESRWDDEAFVAYQAVPLIAKGLVKGVLELFHRAPLGPDPEWLEFLETLAGQAAVAIDYVMMFGSLQQINSDMVMAYDATIEGWARALDLRDKETEGHTRRVTEMTLRLTRALGLEGAELGHMRRGALLHDIGKLGVPDSILLKPGKLTEDEWHIMRRHPEYAYQWLSPIPFLRPALDIPYCHHEKWDGTGYPRGLRGEQIPLAARIFAAVDIWDALRSDRPYRESWSEERVYNHLRALAGTHLDPTVVQVFLRILAAPDEERTMGGTVVTISRASQGGEMVALPVAEQWHAAAERTWQLEEQMEELLRVNARLSALVTMDDLTGLKNQRHFREALEAAFSFAVRHEQPLSVALLEIDPPGPSPQVQGRSARNAVLRTVAQVLREQVRGHDLVTRYGEREFALLFPAADAKTCRVVAERLQAALAECTWSPSPVTVSLGLATLSAHTLSAKELVEEAIQALDSARQRGTGQSLHHNGLPRVALDGVRYSEPRLREFTGSGGDLMGGSPVQTSFIRKTLA